MTRQYPITGYGATPDAGTLQTKFIQSAIDRCFSDGGGEVVIPRGTFMSGDIRLRDHVTLRLLSGAVLLGSRDPMDYFNHRSDTLQPIDKAEMTDRRFVSFHTIENNTSYDPTRVEYEYVRRQSSRWNNALIRAINAEDVAVIGEKDSIIDGADCFDPEGEEDYRGPHGITFHDCKNVRFEGYTIRNTGNWAHNLNRCENVTMENVIVLAGHDGIHMSVCRNIRISDSDFRTGDDCIAGFANVNTLVERCHINSSCSAFRFGGTNMLVRDCEICGPGEYGFRGALSREEKGGLRAVAEGRRTQEYALGFHILRRLQPADRGETGEHSHRELPLQKRRQVPALQLFGKRDVAEAPPALVDNLRGHRR